MKSNSEMVTVYYDGLCHLCSREINHYKKMRGAEKIRFVDITNSEFNAQGEGVDPQLVHKTLHAKDQDGNIHMGVDSFILIWKQLEALKKIATLASFTPIKQTLDFGYSLFALLRPILPRKSCVDSPYCDLKTQRNR